MRAVDCVDDLREVFYSGLERLFTIMQPQISEVRMTRAEQEAQTEARRLTGQIDEALAAVAVRSNSDADGLEACADRLERAARDLVVALRELALERRIAREQAD
jgi:hypothetical protein